MDTDDDPLWSADSRGDAELARLQQLLGRYRHVAPAPHVVLPARRPAARRRQQWIAAVAATLCFALAAGGWLGWRLSWSSDVGWPVASPQAQRERLQVGDRIATDRGERVRVDVARIGSLVLSPQTRVALLETRTGHHRITLETGHLRARIWAPPGWFGVHTGAAEVIDLGCEFDMWTSADGSGRAVVHSGWIMHSLGGRDTLVPAGHALRFDARGAGIPLRQDAEAQFAAAIAQLDTALAAGARAPSVEQAVAAQATETDMVTLLTLLTRYPMLADGPLYARTAQMLGVSAADAGHRRAWSQGNTQAIDAWWDRVPRPPKQWWLYWRDALPWGGEAWL